MDFIHQKSVKRQTKKQKQNKKILTKQKTLEVWHWFYFAPGVLILSMSFLKLLIHFDPNPQTNHVKKK